VATAAAVQAQLPLLHSRFHLAEPGTWARYSLSGAKSQGLKDLYLGVVGEQAVKGKRHLWFEWTTVAGPDTSTVKLLLPADSLLSLKARRVIVKQGGSQAMEIPFGGLVLESLMGQQSALGIDLEDMPSALEKALETGHQIETLGTSTATVAGKSIETDHLRLTDRNGRAVELWLSSAVPFFSIVRLTAEGLQVQLADWGGSGAVSRIGEDHRSLDLKSIIKGLRQPE